MRIVGAFFAESVRTAEGKLDVWGGVLDTVELHSPVPVVHLVVLLQRGPDDLGSPTLIHVAVTGPSGEPTAVLYGKEEVSEFDFSVQPMSLPNRENNYISGPFLARFGSEGRYAFTLSVGEQEPLAIALHVEG
ncbi:DUF6941 family protein [Nocardia sp. NBC_01388]|uniref:DUF6941 family protein n=1 Tax=Nocardia sp. NBC_01388 TaxID=2903596 RepID=UPI00324A4D4C